MCSLRSIKSQTTSVATLQTLHSCKFHVPQKLQLFTRRSLVGNSIGAQDRARPLQVLSASMDPSYAEVPSLHQRLSISDMTADTNKLTDLLQRWDAEHKALYKDIRAQRDEKKLEEQSSDHLATQGEKQRYMEAKRKEEEDERKFEYTKTLEQICTDASKHPSKGSTKSFSADALMKQLVKYGEMAQVTYDKLETTNVYSKRFGKCRDNEIKLHHDGQDSTLFLGKDAGNYKEVSLIYADSGAYKLVKNDEGQGKNFVGFVAVEDVPAGHPADVAIVWRGTITKDEWLQDAKAYMVAWKSGTQAADVPRKLNLQPWTWLGTTTAFGLAVALYFAKTHTKPLKELTKSVESEMTEAVLFLFEQRKALANHIISPLPATLQQVATALLEPLFWLGGNVTAAALGLIRSVSTVSEGAAGFVSNAPTGTLLLASLGVGVVIGTTSLLLGQQVRSSKTNLELLMEDLRGLPEFVAGWTFYGWVSGAYSRLSHKDVRVSYGFKEMYCDADTDGSLLKTKEDKDEDGSLTLVKKGEALGPPRHQVFRALSHLITEKGVKIGSITTTGHSLGGALAALCAFDIADCLEQYPARKTVNQRREALQESRIKAEGVRLSEQAFDILDNAQGAFNKAGLSKDANKMYIHTQEAIDSFCEKVLEPGEDIIPVTAVTFGAPRVGDISFARKFGDPRLMSPPWAPRAFFLNINVAIDRITTWVATCSWWASTHGFDLENHLLWFVWTYAIFMFAWLSGQTLASVPSINGKWAPIITDGLLAVAAFWQFFPLVISNVRSVYEGVLRLLPSSKQQPKECRLRMLRVVNQGDAVPRVPLGPLYGGKWFRHGGVELRRSPYILHEFTRLQNLPLVGAVLGAPLGALHNLEVYLHLVDATRDRYLMNKSDDVLIKACGAAVRWYQPVLNKGLHWDPKTQRVTEDPI